MLVRLVGNVLSAPVRIDPGKGLLPLKDGSTPHGAVPGRVACWMGGAGRAYLGCVATTTRWLALAIASASVPEASSPPIPSASWVILMMISAAATSR